MNILMVLRLYSHLVPMMEQEEWKPLGMPAVCKLLEGISRWGICADVVLIEKTYHAENRQPRIKEFQNLPGIRFHIVPLAAPIGGRIAQLKNSWKQFGYVFRLFTKKHHGIFYCDRAHMSFGAVMAWCGYKVVLRLHGAANLPNLVTILVKRMLPSLRLASFGAPFALIVGSRDGSAYDQYVTGRFHPNTPFFLKLNGVDPFKATAEEIAAIKTELQLEENVPVILMSGRMDADKYPLEFLESIRELNQSGRKCCGVFVGGGAMEDQLREYVQEHGLQKMVRFCGQVEHKKMQAYLGACNIYVSLSLYANSTNTVLEAMRAGKCILTFGYCQKTGRDEQNLSKDHQRALVLIDRKNVQNELTAALTNLLDHPEIVRQKEEEVRLLAEKELQTWDERINWEIDQMRDIAEGRQNKQPEEQTNNA